MEYGNDRTPNNRIYSGLFSKEGPWRGIVNAAVTGSLGNIIVAALLIILGLFGGIFGFAGLIAVIVNLIYCTIIMGISGAVGRMVAGDRY